jgi:ribulose kinase
MPQRIAGVPVAFSSYAYSTSFPHPGWAEQNPADWWQAMGTAVRTAVASSSVPAKSIAGICVDTTCCTVVALNEGE